MRLKDLTAVLVASVSVAAICAPANAQTDEADNSSGLGDIVVTAQKRSESAQDIPVSVQALDGDTLARNGDVDLFSTVKSVPGVVFSRAPDDGLGLTFRGLGTLARSHAFEQSVALFTDGVFLGKGRLYTTSMFDIERMEFIKGSQSTLLGKNASLGAINVTLKQPGDVFGVQGRLAAEVEHGGYTGDLAADIPVSDNAAFRLVGHYNDLDGWVTNTATGREGPVHKDLGLRALMRLDLSDTVRLNASYQFTNNRQFGTNFQLTGNLPAIYGEGNVDLTSALLTGRTSTGDPEHRMKTHIAQAKLEVDIGSNLLTLQSSYITYKLNFLDDFDYSIDDTVNFLRIEDYDQFAQEIRFQSPTGGSVEYMVGGFFMDSRWNALDSQQWQVPAFPPPPDPTSGQLFNGSFATDFSQKARAYSVFAAGSIRLGEAVRINGGVRYTRETKDVVMSRAAIAPFTIWNSFANPPFPATSLEHNSDFFDGNISLQYDIADDVMVYAAFGHGSKSGGYVETNTIAVPPALLVNGQVPPELVAAGALIKDEFTKNYEIGLKSTLLDRRLRFNILGFWTDVKNFQDTVFTGGPLGFITFNGPVRSKGFEVETAFKATPELELNASLTYADSKGTIQPIDQTTNLPAVDGSGNPVYQRFRRSQAPKVTLNAAANYDTDVSDTIDLHLGASLHHRSKMYNQRQEFFPSKALTTVDLSAGLRFGEGRWSLDAVVKNVFNEISEDFAFPSADPRFSAFYGSYIAGPTPGRTILLTLGFEL